MTSSSSPLGGNGTTVTNLPYDTMSSNSASSLSTSLSTGTSTLSTTSAADLQTTFLTLLVTQLQNQDPTAPVDSSEMTSQLAQINMVSGIAQLNTSLTSLSTQLTASQQTQAAQLIGSDVLAPGNTVQVQGGVAAPFGVQLTSSAANLTLTVTNSAGAVVNTINAGAQAAGTVPFNWTPTDTAGNALPDGTYTINASYTSSTGAQVSPTTLSAAQVESVVQQAGGTPGLVLSNGSTVGLAQVASIFPSTTTTATTTASAGTSTSSSN